MVLKSYAKINLNLIVNKKLANGLHNIQSVYCLVDSFDTISIKKNKTIKKDKILILGAHAKYISPSNNSVSKLLKLMRKYKLISDYYSIKITKRIRIMSLKHVGPSLFILVIVGAVLGWKAWMLW